MDAYVVSASGQSWHSAVEVGSVFAPVELAQLIPPLHHVILTLAHHPLLSISVVEQIVFQQ